MKTSIQLNGVQITLDTKLPKASWLGFNKDDKLICFCMSGVAMWSAPENTCVRMRVGELVFKSCANHLAGYR